MSRELPRTILSLSPRVQIDIDPDDYEIIVVDNGSDVPFEDNTFTTWGVCIRHLYMTNPNQSPVTAINLGLSIAQGEICGVFIDGARMASPGLLSSALKASYLHPEPVISTVGFHLGPLHQSKSVSLGYDQAFEDFLLASIDWSADAYRLFKIACYAGSSPKGWFGPTSESNAIFLKRSTWNELGGYDMNFKSPGGGLSNLDLFKRALELQPDGLVVLLGEGTFHQFHGGTSSNSEVSKWDLFLSEYQKIRGKNWEMPVARARYYGTVHPYSINFLQQSINMIEA